MSRVPKTAVLGRVGKGLDVIEQAVDEATLAIGAEAVGCMEVLYKATVEYCKTREQFGQPIGKFQVLQHRMVDMFMEYEQSKSLMFMAAMRLAEGYGPEAQKAVSAFKVQVGKSGRFVGQNAVQLHGGMGMTDELSDRPLLQTSDDDRHDVRQRRPSSEALRSPCRYGSDTDEPLGSWKFEQRAGLVLESGRDRVAASIASKSKIATSRIGRVGRRRRPRSVVHSRHERALALVGLHRPCSSQREYRVAAMDLTGMGDSDFRYEYDPATYASEIVGVLDAAGFGPDSIVVAHSFGGYMAVKAANLFPDRFAALVLVDSGIRHPDEPFPIVRRWAAAPNATLIAKRR